MQFIRLGRTDMIVNSLVQALLVMSTVAVSANSLADERPNGYNSPAQERPLRSESEARPAANPTLEANAQIAMPAQHEDDEEEMD